MTEKTYNVGDMAEWPLVPDGAMVRVETAIGPLTEVLYYRRLGERGCTVGGGGATTWASTDHGTLWKWTAQRDRMSGKGRVTIVALDLTGQETAADLQRMAEVFEVREAYLEAFRTGDDGIDALPVSDSTIETLHALGWRKDMTAEDAARLLAEHSK